MNELFIIHVLTLNIFYWVAFFVKELQDFIFNIICLTIIFMLIDFTCELLNVI